MQMAPVGQIIGFYPDAAYFIQNRGKNSPYGSRDLNRGRPPVCSWGFRIMASKKEFGRFVDPMVTFSRWVGCHAIRGALLNETPSAAAVRDAFIPAA
jgi:hypothetical protein